MRAHGAATMDCQTTFESGSRRRWWHSVNPTFLQFSHAIHQPYLHRHHRPHRHHHLNHHHQHYQQQKQQQKLQRPSQPTGEANVGRLVALVLIWALSGVPGGLALPTPPMAPASTGGGLTGHDWGDSPPPAHLFGSLAHGLVFNLPQKLGRVDPSDSNCTDCDMEFRQKIEKIKLEQLQQDLLRHLKLDHPPNVSRVAAETSFTKPVSRFLHREREELRQNFGNTNYAEISEIVSFGEEAANFSDNAMVMFRLLSPSAEQSGSLKVMSASLYMLLRYRKHSSRSHGQVSSSSSGGGGDKPRRRVKVNIYPVYPGQNPEDLEADTNKTMFGSLGVMVRHTRWQKLILPVSEIQKVVDSTSKVLHLRITCDNCGADIEPVLAARRSNGRRKVRAGWKRKMNKRRPLLIIHTAVAGTDSAGGAGSAGSPSADGQQQPEDQQPPSEHSHVIRKRLAPNDNEPEARCPRQPAGAEKKRCTRRKLWVSFKDIGWDDWILYPKGYYANYCEGSCPLYRRAAFDGSDLYGKTRRRMRRLGHVYHRRQHKHHQKHPRHKALPRTYHHSQVIQEHSRLSTRRGHQKMRSWSRPSFPRNQQQHSGASPCCQPRKMSDLHLIYFDENGNIVKTLLKNMVVERCGCV